MEREQILDILAALSQGVRLDVFRLLVSSGPSGMAAGAIAQAGGLSPATLSFHLKELRNAGLVTCTQQGRSRIYAPDFAAMRELLTFLTKNCCR